MADVPKPTTEGFSSTARSGDETLADPKRLRPPIAKGERLGGRYLVGELLGRGAMGAVYSAPDEKLGERFALKFVMRDPHGIGQLREEVRLAQRVTHANVCRTFDLVEAGGHA